jgi:hypothetical protein
MQSKPLLRSNYIILFLFLPYQSCLLLLHVIHGLSWICSLAMEPIQALTKLIVLSSNHQNPLGDLDALSKAIFEATAQSPRGASIEPQTLNHPGVNKLQE